MYALLILADEVDELSTPVRDLHFHDGCVDYRIVATDGSSTRHITPRHRVYDIVVLTVGQYHEQGGK